MVPAIKANPMPHYGVPFKPKVPEQRHVEVCPFSFDARDRERLIQKEKKIEELQKEEVGAEKRVGLPKPRLNAVQPDFQVFVFRPGHLAIQFNGC